VGRRLVVLVALCIAVAIPSGAAAPAPDDPFAGLGTWVDIWDGGVWSNPEAAVARMRAFGVRTLYLETSNYSQKVALSEPALLGRFVDAAHANGVTIVAWYLPSLVNVSRDLHRALAAVRFRSPAGQGFDAFALDIEASVVKPVPLRNARLHTLSTKLRTAVGPDYQLGAIVPSPRGMELKPAYWPDFPYEDLARMFDAFLPMGYFTYRFHTPAPTAAYTRANVDLIREGAGDETVPVHAVGGLAASSTPAQLRAFVRAAREEGVVGFSLYDYASTPARFWPSLAG
jgi:hypothetical protein